MERCCFEQAKIDKMKLIIFVRRKRDEKHLEKSTARGDELGNVKMNEPVNSKVYSR